MLLSFISSKFINGGCNIQKVNQKCKIFYILGCPIAENLEELSLQYYNLTIIY